MIPSIGRIVHYKLSNDDVDRGSKNYLRQAFTTGNPLRAGQVFPAIIVAVHGVDDNALCNLQVFLDGPDTLWVTSRHVGDENGQYKWPAVSRPTIAAK